MARRPFSLCVIAFNEERNLARCLESAAFADDVVVLDSGSTDRTVELARSRGARVFVEPFRGHVGQKNRAIELANHAWVLALDADEEVTPALRASIERALADDGASVAGYALARQTSYAGRFIRHGGWWPEWRVRLFDRARARWGGEDPHDHIVADGAIARLDGVLHHYAYRDLAHHLEKVNRYTSTMAAGMSKRGVRFAAVRLLLHPPAHFVKVYVLRRGFLDGWRGFILATIGAFYTFMKYAKLWELQRATSRATSRDSRPASE